MNIRKILPVVSAKKDITVIAIIGAGSQVFGFHMCTDICQEPAVKGAEVRLVDVAADRLATMKRLFTLISDKTGMNLKVSAFEERLKALPGSRYVIVSVARQRVDRWEKDLEISSRYGFVEAQGECGGPGGLSLTLRNIPFILAIGKDVEKLAPDALLLNFSNPMTRVCLALNQHTRVRTVGLCHGLLEGQGIFSRLLNRPVKVKGCGINHFNWIFDAQCDDTGEDVWQDIVKAIKTKTELPDWEYIRELFTVFGRVPTPSDHHISDFIHHWRGAKNGLNKRYHLHPKEMGTYRTSALDWEKRIFGYLNGERDLITDIKEFSGEGAVPILSAMSGLIPPYQEISVNIPNRGYIPNLPEGAVVEVPAAISPGRIEGEKMEELPAGIRSLILRQLDIAELSVEAAVKGDYKFALQALAIDPLITDLQMARSYLDDILAAHRDVLPQFFC